MMQREGQGRKKARTMLGKAGYSKMGGHFAKGGHVKGGAAEDVHKHETHLHKGQPKTKLKEGGCADGGVAKPRADRLARGGKTKHGKSHTTVNVVVGRSHPQPVPVPKPIPVPVPAGAGPGGPGPMPPPPGAGAPPPGMPPDGGGPMPFKKGGRVHRANGGNAEASQRDKIKGMPAGQFKRGGRTKGYPIEDGAGGGLARIQKAKAYGA